MAPHADETTAAPANGTAPANSTAPDSPTFKSLNHLKSYPLVADSINTFSSSPIGQKTIALSASAYSRFIAPLSPYLSKAHPYVEKAHPYVQKADTLADSSLEQLETRFPIIKETTAEDLKSVVIDSVGYPRKMVAEVIVRGQDFAKEKQEYVFKVYEDEFTKTGGGGGYVPMAKAGITSAFVVSSELMGAIANYLGSKKESRPASPQQQREETVGEKN